MLSIVDEDSRDRQDTEDHPILSFEHHRRPLCLGRSDRLEESRADSDSDRRFFQARETHTRCMQLRAVEDMRTVGFTTGVTWLTEYSSRCDQ